MYIVSALKVTLKVSIWTKKIFSVLWKSDLLLVSIWSLYRHLQCHFLMEEVPDLQICLCDQWGRGVLRGPRPGCLKGYVEHCELADHAGHVDDLDLGVLLGVARLRVGHLLLLEVVCLLFLLMIAAPCQRRSRLTRLDTSPNKFKMASNKQPLRARAHQTKAVETCASPLAKRKTKMMPFQASFSINPIYINLL